MDILYVATSGRDDPVKAALPFHLALNGSLARGDAPQIVLAGDATDLILGDTLETLEPLGVPPFRELAGKAVDNRVPVFV
jgi:predicted peroxiredoxin